MTTVPHPEVDETLYVHECVVRVACPQCKMAAGSPCKGARFDWLEKGERRGFRHVQYHHMARHSLYQDWKSNGSPARIPTGVLAFYEKLHGDFPKKVDRKTKVEGPPAVRRTPKRRAAKKAKRERLSDRLATWEVIHSHGLEWRCLPGNGLWSTNPFVEYGNYESIDVFVMPPALSHHVGNVHLRFRGKEHRLGSKEEGFALARKLIIRGALVDVLNQRALWRIRELELRFGAGLNEEI